MPQRARLEQAGLASMHVIDHCIQSRDLAAETVFRPFRPLSPSHLPATSGKASTESACEQQSNTYQDEETPCYAEYTTEKGGKMSALTDSATSVVPDPLSAAQERGTVFFSCLFESEAMLCARLKRQRCFLDVHRFTSLQRPHPALALSSGSFPNGFCIHSVCSVPIAL